jgi:hypothetical protein
MLKDAISHDSGSGWFTAHLHRKTTGRAQQPSDKGTHGVSSAGNSGHRVGGRSHNYGDAPVQRAYVLTAPADFKRLISYPKRERMEGPKEPEGMPVCR